MKMLKAIFGFHSHYFGIPHVRESDSQLVVTCYECGAERVVKAEVKVQ